MPLAEHDDRIEEQGMKPQARDAAHTGKLSVCSSPINRQHLAKYTLGDPELEREILQLFVDQLPRLLKQLSEATTDREWYIAAHSLKGSARAVGAERLGELAAAAETQAAERHRFDLQPIKDDARGIIDYLAQAA
ncbi:MAG: Hpt domain-containing protein [Pseudomonadota bacterium]